MLGTKYCIGFYNLIEGLKVPCPQSTVLTTSREYQCAHCRQKGASFFARTGKTSNNIKQERYLASLPHLLYLSLFGSSLIKVGVAAEHRSKSRVLEQGVSACLFIARSDGVTIRRIEKEISRSFGITEKVRTEDKLKRIKEEITSEMAEQKLLATLKTIYADINDVFKQYFLYEPEYLFNLALFEVNRNELANQVSLITDLKPDACITGVVVGVLGSVLLLKNNDKLLAIDTKIMRGYLTSIVVGDNLESKNKGIDLSIVNINNSSQLGLF